MDNRRDQTTGVTRIFIKFSLFTVPLYLGVFWLSIEAVFAPQDRANAFLLAGIGLALAAAVNAFGFHFIVGKPLGHLLNAIRNSSFDGRYVRTDTTDHSEFASLTRSFNALQAKQDQNVRRLQRTHEALSEIYNTTPTLMLTLSMEGHVTHTSTFLLETTGYCRNEIIDAPLTKFLDARSAVILTTQIMPLLLNTGHVRDIALRLKCKSGVEMDVLFSAAARSPGSVSATAERKKWLFCAMSDVTLLKKAEHKLRQVSITDHLTGLANRADLSRYMNDLFAEDVISQERVAILFIDLDNFKSINDSHGHAAGDKVLADIAERFVANLRTNDYIARIGGDEFAVVCRNVKNEAGAVLAAERLIECLKPAIALGAENAEGYVSASIGIALLNARVRSPNAALKMADSAMYQAKKSGRNTCAVWKQSVTPSRKAPVLPDQQ